MKATNSCVLALTLILGVTIFFSSLVALQRHNTDEATTGGNKNELQARGNLARISSISKEYINASVTAGLKNVAKFNIFAAHRSAEDMGFMSLPHHIPDVVSEENTTPPAKKTESKISAPAMHNVTNTQGISCIPSFESICEMYSYVRFWKKRFNGMDCHQSPARHPLGIWAPVDEQKYLVFEPDRGGWNNIRMAAETAMIFAHATGRVLVMPPIAVWYLLWGNKNNEDNKSTFEMFFDLKKIHESIDIMPMVDFLEKVAKPGFLKKPFPAKLTPKELAAGASSDRANDRLWRYLESASYIREWEPGKIYIGFNMSKAPNGSLTFGNFVEDARSQKMVCHGRKLLPYDDQLHSERVIFFPGDYRNTHRILTHFYSYLFWHNPHEERIYKRLVRDRLHYHDNIFCAAGRAVKILHQEAAALMPSKPLQDPHNYDSTTLGGNTNRDATFFAFHIRRGDFQYKQTRLSGQEIWDATKHLFDPTVTKLLYIATDEKDKSFFKPFMDEYKVRFLADVRDLAHLGDNHLNQNHIGMIEQVICANAHTFVGTPYSTFTGYITRMRGYYRDGRYDRTYYTMKADMYQLQKQPELKGPFWAREFAVAHRNIDDDSRPVPGGSPNGPSGSGSYSGPGAGAGAATGRRLTVVAAPPLENIDEDDEEEA